MIAFNIVMVSAIQHKKKHGTLHECVCHTHAETMLIFSV